MQDLTLTMLRLHMAALTSRRRRGTDGHVAAALHVAKTSSYQTCPCPFSFAARVVVGTLASSSLVTSHVAFSNRYFRHRSRGLPTSPATLALALLLSLPLTP